MLFSNEEIILTSDESSSSSSSIDDDNQEELSLNKQYISILENDHINALKNLQISYNQLESCYLKSVNELEYKFHEQCSYLFEQRSDIINGKYEPNDDECQLKPNSIDIIERPILSMNSIGIPSFWLQTLKQVPMIAEIIEEWDEPILKCLIDIKLRLQTKPIIGFTLEFYFNNQSKIYFHNEILTKFYEIQIEPDDNNLLFYEGTSIIRSIGCHIDWIDLTKNRTRNNQTGELQSSFFQFFTSSTMMDDDWKLARDFQIGYYIREYLIPKAILYYTGEIFDDDDDDDYELTDDNDDEENSLKEDIGEGEH